MKTLTEEASVFKDLGPEALAGMATACIIDEETYPNRPEMVPVPGK